MCELRHPAHDVYLIELAAATDCTTHAEQARTCCQVLAELVAYHVSGILLKSLTAVLSFPCLPAFPATSDTETGGHHDRQPSGPLLLDKVHQAIERAARDENLCAVVVLAVFNLRIFAERFGPCGSEECLEVLARCVTASVRRCDTVGRLVSGELVLILEGLRDAEDAGAVVAKLAHRLNQPLPLGASSALAPSCRFGIAVSSTGTTDPCVLLAQAVTALHGTGQSDEPLRFFKPEIKAKLDRSQAMAQQLSSALKDGAIYPVFQPVIDLRTGSCIALEALLRWSHPMYGSVSPSEFIPIAEEAGLSGDITRAVVEAVGSAQTAWRDAAACHVPVAVNISAVDFSSAEFVPNLLEHLDTCSINPEALIVEITEGSVFSSPRQARQNMEQLIERGVIISMDDFGSGYSSLSHLHQYPFGIVKIDRAFVQHLGSDPRSSSIVRGIILMAQGVGARVVAEGVETEAQLDWLREHRCDAVQGFLFGAPQIADRVLGWLATGIESR
jgi:EAL domain-containing protein (putative c-di-GMP-specific phosphodiesterase class I)/GGDEF domain-containing protein